MPKFKDLIFQEASENKKIDLFYKTKNQTIYLSSTTSYKNVKERLQKAKEELAEQLKNQNPNDTKGWYPKFPIRNLVKDHGLKIEDIDPNNLRAEYSKTKY